MVAPRRSPNSKKQNPKLEGMRLFFMALLTCSWALFVPRPCLYCVHFEPIILRLPQEFGRCKQYKDDSGKIGYADGARIDQSKCGQGAVWFHPKKRNATYIVPKEELC
jgi:hypothetical protein